MLTKLFGHVSRRDVLFSGLHAPAANTAAVITLAASPGFHHVIHAIQWSYSGTAPTTGRLTIAVNAVTKWDVDVTALGPGGFQVTIAGAANQAVVVTLAAGGAGATGKVNIQYTTESARAYAKLNHG